MSVSSILPRVPGRFRGTLVTLIPTATPATRSWWKCSPSGCTEDGAHHGDRPVLIPSRHGCCCLTSGFGSNGRMLITLSTLACREGRNHRRGQSIHPWAFYGRTDHKLRLAPYRQRARLRSDLPRRPITEVGDCHL